jgi:hypothetical protein
VLPAEVAGIDAWIAKQDDDPSRPEAIRRLIERGLASEATLTKPRRAPKPK